MSIFSEALDKIFARLDTIEKSGKQHFDRVRERLDMIENAYPSILSGLDRRLDAVQAYVKNLEKLQPQELPTKGEMVLAKLEYSNGRTYYSVVYHDGFKWRRQGGGSLYQTYERYSTYSRFPPRATTVPVRVVSWCEVVLPT